MSEPAAPINLDSLNHSQPVETNTPLPGDAILQEICVQGYYVTLTPGSNIVYKAEHIANILCQLLNGNVVQNCATGLRRWLLKSRLARATNNAGLELDPENEAQALATLDMLQHPENYD